MKKRFLAIGEYGAAGMYEEPDRSLFYRKALGIRRYYEKCPLCKYEGKPLYPSGLLPHDPSIKPRFFYGMQMNNEKMFAKDASLAKQYLADFHKYESSVPKEHRVGANMYTHSLPHYERILQEGLLSYIPRIEKIEDRDMREGLLHIMEGIRTYLARSIAYLTETGAEPALIAALKKVPLHPAENIYEALVSWNFVMYLDNCDNLGCLVSGLAPYFKGEDILPILENLFDNLAVNEGYSMVLDTSHEALSLLCMEASRGRCSPLIELFVDENTSEMIWEKAFSLLRAGGGQPAFYNKALLCRLGAKFHIPDADLKRFCGVGCTEPSIAGLSHIGSTDAGINLLLLLEETMGTSLATAPDFTTFYDLYIQNVQKAVDVVTEEICASQKKRAAFMPLPMRTLLVDDCIDRQTDFNAGGARYQWSIISFAGIINVIDSLLVIEDMIFRKKELTGQEMLTALSQNSPAFLEKARKHPRAFGVDDSTVNAFSHQLTSDIFSMLDGKKPYIGEAFLPASIQFNSQAEGGKNIGATPDGRESGAPLCDSIGAIFNKDKKGPTALLKSVTSLDLERALGVPVLNFNVLPDFDENALKSLILSYMRLGGIQMQLTCASPEMLQKAYENPDEYPNLIVRVGGYSDYFCRLSAPIQKMIMERTIQEI